ncbi:HPr kinase/phosphorylase [Coxiella endosymbiont of Amblyomma sculptum]|uniref:HPr kinase/phosphatase C-terminal domain-containing protein n=1 Tax=Coxiella endosymbiont of Amblyomma sculptum TaxID=2487929 RepID=UPI00132F10AA|nr:HPr kinase/phosphatase C-terminal domain-containing protein [Coxiella endosymbiont of Amblyomma sculptum]QHG92380.1 HPr kinase/phosphorylase [Coxiella endosymbiont of Amblyomma sculptum]
MKNLEYKYSDRTALHANFVVVKKLGVLIMGNPSIGKSELTLSLLDRGHQMVCDDVVDITYKDNQLIGSCPSISYGYILISGIGIIHVPKFFGPNSIVSQYGISLIIKLIKHEKNRVIADLFNPISQKEKILDTTVPSIMFPISRRRGNLPLLIEMLIRNQNLKMKC